MKGRPCLQPIFLVSTQGAVVLDAYVPGSLVWEHIVLEMSLMFPHVKTQAERSNFIFFSLSFVNKFVFKLGTVCLTTVTFITPSHSPYSLQGACLPQNVHVLLNTSDDGR